jgi:Rho GTPase-activating protein 1
MAKRGPSSTYASSEGVTSPQLTSPQSAVSAPASEPAFRRPSIPFSATSSTTSRSPSINSLARPVYPVTPQVPIINAPTKSSTLPIPAAAPRLRTPSPSLMQRMPSFENFAKDQQKKDDADSETGLSRGRTLKPKKMNLKKQSVEDLRRLYEERAGTASVLVQAGKQRGI